MPTPAVAEPRLPYFLGVDIGGTAIKIGVVDDAGQTLAFESIPTHPERDADDAMQRIAQVMKRLLDRRSLSITDVAAVGVGAPGPMDLQTGLLVQPPQLPHWWGYNLVQGLRQATGRPVALNNDANAAAFGEFWLGCGRDVSSMVLVTLGTGVGGGIVTDRRMLNGQNSFGGEFGHLMVDPSPDARLCIWGGGRGHFEAYASASAVALRTRQRLDEGAGGILATINGEVTPLDVYRAAQQSDPLALELIDEAAFWLGIGLTTITHVLDPGLIAIGGAMTFGGHQSPVGCRFLEQARETFRARTFDNVFAGTRIDFAVLGADAGYLGAAGYARQVFAGDQILSS